MLLALVIRPLTTHPFRDGVPMEGGGEREKMFQIDSGIHYSQCMRAGFDKQMWHPFFEAL